MRRELLRAAVAIAAPLLVACRDALTAPSAESTSPGGTAYAIQDGAHAGGNAHFFFLPPLVPATAHGGPFDPTLKPVIDVCTLGGDRCLGGPIMRFTMTGAGGTGRIRLEPADERYVADWRPTTVAGVASATVYRISVKVGTTMLGYLDVRPGQVGGMPSSDGVVAWGSAAVPISVRIEQGALSPPKPLWKFTMLGAVSKPTADYLGGFEAAVRFMRAQIDTVNSRFNTPGVFAGEFLFALDSIYQYTGTGWEQVVEPHPGFDYKYVVDGYQGPGGWFGDYDLVFLSWPIDQIRTPGATDAIVHEFGHARGAIDTYAIKADGEFNPVNGASYHPGRSIMDFPYGETVWDRHSINLINRSAGVVHAPPTYITEAFPPSIGIVVVNEEGRPQIDARVRLYPVPWFQNRVERYPRYDFNTDQNGSYVFYRNPYEPGTPAPWLMVYPNYLVIATAGSMSGYGWMPITDVQNAWFADPTAPYRLRIVVHPATATASTAGVRP